MVKIFSIKDKYSEKIFSKEKLVELRRQDVKIKENEKCLIYTTSPVKKITGFFIVKKKVRLPIKKLWQLTKDIAGVTKSEFLKYFNGCIEGTAIFFKYVKQFSTGASLDEIKTQINNFKPPQSYLNLNHSRYELLKKILGDDIKKLSDF
jgi:predicted transcriptional regulator